MTSSSYFMRVTQQTPTEFWINNPTREQAGLAVARKFYRIMEDCHYPGTFIAGGARGLHHFTEMVGGKV